MQKLVVPLFENDPYYFILDPEDTLKICNDKYMYMKKIAFNNFNPDKNPFLQFKDRPSFSGIEELGDISGTIYTWSAIGKNDIPYMDMIKVIQQRKDDSRKCVVRLADSFKDYMDPELNTSCLNIIHYFQNRVFLFFRASDMKNELLYDLHLIKEFFIDPVFENYEPEIHVVASTAQNITDVEQLIL